MSLSILIVDDNPDDREALQRALAEMPDIAAPVLEATDDVSCLAQLDSDRDIDCILLDYSLPGRDGLKVLREILKHDPMSAVVMVTGQGDEAIAVDAMKTGAQDYLTKDAISAASLTRSISNATERTRMQRVIRDQQENLKTFAEVIVHDLRAPLRGISQAIGMLTEDLPDAVASENAEMLGFVVEGARRMDALIIALKAYTEIDGTLPVFEPVDLTAQIDHVCSNLATLIQDHGAIVTCENTLPTVQGNPPQIEQLLRNLIGNGIKYNRSEPPEIRVSSSQYNDHWVIDIADNGIGIEAKYLRRIFEPFKRLHRDSEFDGTGLGLATCKKIVERHQGTLTCHSEPGRGSTFQLKFPMAGDRT